MPRYLLAGVIFVLTALCQPVHAQAQLSWKLKEGDSFYVELVDSRTTEIVGLPNMKEEQTLGATLTVDKKNDDGSLVLTQKIDVLRPSGMGQATQMLGQVFKEIEGSTVKITLDPQYQLKKIEGQEEVIKKVSENAKLPPQVAGLVKNIVSQHLRMPAERVFGIKLPDKPVAKGDKWEYKTGAPLGPLGKANIVQKYTYEGNENGKEKIVINPEITFGPADKDAATPGFTVKKADLKAESAKGQAFFDAQAGRLVSQEVDMHLKGSMTLSAMGQEFPLDVDIKSSNKTRVLDKMP